MADHDCHFSSPSTLNLFYSVSETPKSTWSGDECRVASQVARPRGSAVAVVTKSTAALEVTNWYFHARPAPPTSSSPYKPQIPNISLVLFSCAEQLSHTLLPLLFFFASRRKRQRKQRLTTLESLLYKLPEQGDLYHHQSSPSSRIRLRDFVTL